MRAGWMQVVWLTTVLALGPACVSNPTPHPVADATGQGMPETDGRDMTDDLDGDGPMNGCGGDDVSDGGGGCGESDATDADTTPGPDVDAGDVAEPLD